MLYLSDGDQFLLASKKKTKSKSSYAISLDENDTSRESGNYFGKVGSYIYTQPPPGLNVKIDRMFDIIECAYISCDQTLVKASHRVDESVARAA